MFICSNSRDLQQLQAGLFHCQFRNTEILWFSIKDKLVSVQLTLTLVSHAGTYRYRYGLIQYNIL